MTPPLVVSAPLRFSLAGGGSDLPEAYERREVHLLSMVCTWRIRVTIDEAPADAEDGPLGWFARRRHDRRVSVDAPVSPGAGLGGSGALMVALTLADAALDGRRRAPPDLALDAYRAEREEIGASVGFQDHAASALGGVVEMRAGPGRPVELARRPDLYGKMTRMLEHSVIVAETSDRRNAAPLLDRLAQRLPGAAPADHAPPSATTIATALATEDGAAFGTLLRKHWIAKTKSAPDVSTRAADRILAAALHAGATGGKLMGAGGGGFILLAGPAERRSAVCEAVTGAGGKVRDVGLECTGAIVESGPGA